jgi:hypothetical protein
LRGQALDIDAAASATRLVVPGALTATEVRVRATGDPRRRVRATLSAHGDGLLSALGPSASGATRSATHVDATVDLDLRDPTRLRAQLQRATVNLRGARATVSGDLALLQPEGRRTSPAGNLSIRTERHGALSLSVRQGRTQATLEALDLTWLRPLVASLPEIEGIVDGTFDVNPAELRSARADLRVRHGRVAPIGAFDATLSVTPLGGVTHLQAMVDSTRGRTLTGGGAHAEVDLQIEIPRRTSETGLWIDGVQTGHIALERIDLAAWNDLLPTGIGMQGIARVGVDFTRESPTSPLRVVARTEGNELTAGLRVARRVLPVVVPLSARAVSCVEIVRGSLVNAPFEFRVALDRSARGNPEAQSVSCGEGDLTPSRSLIAFGARMRGPWLPAVTDAARDLTQRVPRFSSRTLDLLRTATLDARLRVGPIARADWPLRAVPMLARDGAPTLLRPPDVPADARAELNLSALGTIASLAFEATASARSSAVPQLGFSEPLAADLRATLRPRAGETLLGALEFSLHGNSDLSLNAPQAERGHITVDARASAEGARVLERGASAVTLDALDVDASNVLIERFAWARAQRVRGVLAAHLTTTRDAQAPFAATATITGLRAGVGQDADEARETRPVQVGVGARMRARNGGGYTLFSCVEATGRDASPSCDPERPGTAVDPGSALAAVSVPFTGELTSLRPELDGVDVGLTARSFRLDALTPVKRDDNIAGVEGSLDASVRWNGARPAALVGTLHVTGGRADIISLGEPLRDLVVDVEAADGLARISRLSLALGRGHVDLTGSADLRGLAALTRATVTPEATLVSLDLAAEARQLPMGVEGNTYGWIDGTLRYGMRFTRTGATGSLEIDRASVLMKEEQSRNLQPLGTDGDVFVFGRTQLDIARPTAAYPIALRFDVLTPIWMRRSDFAVAIQGHGQVSRERAGWAVGGTIEQASPQSWISVMGKRFELDRLRVVFDGTPAINPQLDIAAHHDTATEGRLTASVGGRLLTPTMDFAAANHPGASQAEVLALIALGRRTSQSANGNSDLGQQAAASIASLFTAMTLGGLASSVSQGGRFLPTLILEPGQGAGRYGAGISLGPRVYLQATYGATSGTVGTTSTAAQLFRVLLEVAITQSWSGSVFGAFGRSSGHSEVPFGAEFFWSP